MIKNMQKKILHKKNYISLDLVNQVRSYYDSINDDLSASSGPYPVERAKLGYQGCWDRNLHYELPDSPIHQVVSQLKQDFEDFLIHQSSIRYLSAPFMPHSDIRSIGWLKKLRDDGHRPGFTFLIPLWWKKEYTPGTAFFNSPANINEPLYSDMLDILPKFADSFERVSMNFSVREVVKWQSPGDLIAWENFQWHCSCHYGNIEYNKQTWAKEFISIETWKIT
jgi:hypothetical protein